MWQRIDTRAHLESQLARLTAVSEAGASAGAAQTASDGRAFKHWLQLYARFLAGTADEARARAVCEALLEPDAATGLAPSLVCGVRKRRALVDAVLPSLRRSQSTDVQRLCRAFAASAKALDAEEAEERKKKVGAMKAKRKRNKRKRGEQEGGGSEQGVVEEEQGSAGGIWARRGGEPARKRPR